MTNFLSKKKIISYNTSMKLINETTYIVKKSKFIAYYYFVKNPSEVVTIFECLKKEHKKAKHIPYAYKIDTMIKKSDDKEPSGTSGAPILSVIEKNELNNAAIFVVRYFGGIKLGSGGLYRAYLSAAKECINKKSE